MPAVGSAGMLDRARRARAPPNTTVRSIWYGRLCCMSTVGASVGAHDTRPRRVRARVSNAVPVCSGAVLSSLPTVLVTTTTTTTTHHHPSCSA